MSHDNRYTAEAVEDHTGIADIRVHMDGKTWHLWGRKGNERELALARSVPEGALPVLLGAGLGDCLEALASQGNPVAVVDRETIISDITQARGRAEGVDNILWIDSEAPETALDQLARWQQDNGNAPLHPVALPLYLRLDRSYYGALNETLKAHSATDFWSQATYPKFQSSTPRVLFFDPGYFLCNEITAALQRLSVEHRIIKLGKQEKGSQAFIEHLLKTVIDFKPDFILTVNHFGMDREGKLAALLEKLNLPLASWFVDNPHLILHEYEHPGTDNTTIFTYDAGNLDLMREKGFTNVHYLPLATDPERFKPGLGRALPEWNCNISFVGNSMITPVSNSLADASLPEELRSDYRNIAARFGESGETSVPEFLRREAEQWHSAYQSFPTPEQRLALESLITWEATRQYRLACVSALLPFTPLIVGDQGWYEQLKSDGWRHLSGLDYYEELPRFYPASTINFNCTSRQMPGAVNQRVFDVPACGGFLLTDYREQMEALFDPESEVVTYRKPEEIPDLVEKFTNDQEKRKKMIRAARARILAEHTYELRLGRLLDVMRRTHEPSEKRSHL